MVMPLSLRAAKVVMQAIEVTTPMACLIRSFVQVLHSLARVLIGVPTTFVAPKVTLQESIVE